MYILNKIKIKRYLNYESNNVIFNCRLTLHSIYFKLRSIISLTKFQIRPFKLKINILNNIYIIIQLLKNSINNLKIILNYLKMGNDSHQFSKMDAPMILISLKIQSLLPLLTSFNC